MRIEKHAVPFNITVFNNGTIVIIWYICRGKVALFEKIFVRNCCFSHFFKNFSLLLFPFSPFLCFSFILFRCLSSTLLLFPPSSFFLLLSPPLSLCLLPSPSLSFPLLLSPSLSFPLLLSASPSPSSLLLYSSASYLLLFPSVFFFFHSTFSFLLFFFLNCWHSSQRNNIHHSPNLGYAPILPL